MSDLMNSVKAAVPIHQAAAALAYICSCIDDGEEDLEGLIKNSFFEAEKDLARRCDSLIMAINTIGKRGTLKKDGTYESGAGLLGTVDEVLRGARQRIEQLENIRDRIKDLAKTAILEFPDQPYAGKLGKLAVQKDAVPSLKLDFETKTTTFTNVTDYSTIRFFGIPDQYFKLHNVWVLDTEALKRDLQRDPQAFPWGHLDQGMHLRVRGISSEHIS